MENTLSSLHKFARFFEILLKIVRIMLIVAMSILLIAALVMHIIPDNVFETGGYVSDGKLTQKGLDAIMEGINDGRIDIDSESYAFIFDQTETFEGTLAEHIVEVFSQIHLPSVLNFIGHMLLILIARLAMLFVLLLFIGKLFKCIRLESSPFTPTSVGLLRKIGILSLVYATVQLLSSGLSSLLASLTFPTGLSYNLHLSFSLSTVVFALLCFCLAFVFNYGRLLQERVDGTAV